LTQGIVLHAGGIPEIDASALQALKEMVHGYQARAVTVCYVKVRERVKRRFIRARIIDSQDSEFVRMTYALP
jgi:anti-anti-sigma regulatory factor